MEELTFGSCVWESWLQGGRFVRHNPLTVIAAIVVLAASGVIAITQYGVHPSPSATLTSGLVRLALELVKVIVMIMLPVQVMRHAMLEEHESSASWLFGKIFWRYLWVGLLLVIICIAILALVFGGGFLLAHSLESRVLRSFVWIVGGVVAVCLVTILWTRLSLLFCHVAIGRTGGWRASWHDTRGHVWRIGLSHLLTALPIQICAIALILGAYFLFGRTFFSAALPYWVAVGQSLTLPVGLIVGSTCLVWFYRRLANTLLDLP
ncbi:hypothetical protein [Trinickia dinghuensis]|uniref:Glycerophosphoryl diester phosphodiesterase membrane domain-containing protein n=1 Tax=Trinickia dinghuensis TaxID=2291023 RepID=A0A3D8K7J9_9BURK|nr:hypothetical protein [Trinickia dinghuensis]RDV00865.1 hypothetical protein DWV00_03790 [Trinickia dinghuensis]